MLASRTSALLRTEVRPVTLQHRLLFKNMTIRRTASSMSFSRTSKLLRTEKGTKRDLSFHPGCIMNQLFSLQL
jgi:hypothetical protein